MPTTDWHVYVVRCRDDALYTGIAKDVARRVAQHEEGRRGARSLRGRRPLRLVMQRAVGEKGLALKVEARIKRLSKAEKERVIGDSDRFDALLASAREPAGKASRSGEDAA